MGKMASGYRIHKGEKRVCCDVYLRGPQSEEYLGFLYLFDWEGGRHGGRSHGGRMHVKVIILKRLLMTEETYGS